MALRIPHSGRTRVPHRKHHKRHPARYTLVPNAPDPLEAPHIDCMRASLATLTTISGDLEPAGGRAERKWKLRIEPSIVVRLKEERAYQLHNGQKYTRQREVQVMDGGVHVQESLARGCLGGSAGNGQAREDPRVAAHGRVIDAGWHTPDLHAFERLRGRWPSHSCRRCRCSAYQPWLRMVFSRPSAATRPPHFRLESPHADVPPTPFLREVLP